MTVFHAPDYNNHEHVSFFSDPETGLRAIIAVHWSGPGLAGGGVRMWPYDDEQKAVTDALRLSKAMSYKFALAGVPIGGGKTVIIGDSATQKTPALLRSLAGAIERLNGRYICGPDVGTSSEDMLVMREVTAHVRGLPGQSGDTSPATGFGVFQAIRAAVRHKFGRDDLAGLRVAVQGAGAVSRALCRHLHDAGAEIVIADIDPGAAERAARDFSARIVSTDAILSTDADVLAPCALGAVLNDDTIPAIRARIVCGGANNQLAEDRHGAALAERDILFIPDYVANAGGAINASSEGPDYNAAKVDGQLRAIYDTCLRICQRADQDGVPVNVAADRIGAEIIAGKN
jgi:leucine dehydrogenase